MNKQEYEKWAVIADEKLQQSNLFKDNAHQKIYKSYNGYAAALGVTVLMIGLVPALVVYYQDNENVCRRNVLEVIAKMLGYETAGTLLETALNSSVDNINVMQKNVINSSIALKQVIRTYKLED